MTGIINGKKKDNPIWKTEIQAAADSIRLRVFGHVMKNNGGYLSQACSSAELFAALYMRIMHLGPSSTPLIPHPFMGVPGPANPNFFNGGDYNGPKAPGLDRFIFSPAHYALVLYAALIEVGRLAPEGLEMFNKDGTTLEMIGAEHSPGVATTTGSLAQALSQAGGIALGRRLKGESGRVFVLMSDGEFQEGQTWEAVQALSYYKLDNVIVYADVNQQQCDGPMTDVMNIEPLTSRLESFGARVFAVDGHDIDALVEPAELAPDGRPTFVLAYTDPTRGIPLMNDRRPVLHYLRFKDGAERTRYDEAYTAMLKQDIKKRQHLRQMRLHLEAFEKLTSNGSETHG
ncbi:MAG: transketolase [Anaerolineae bacterium]|nr:transketolase [Anaerolineae bacterium]